jgi:hypothetical protein
MANYSTARWEAFQYKLNEMMQKPEFKHKPSPALMKFLKSTDFLIPASEKERILGVKQSDQDTVYVNLLNKQSISTGSARAAAHTGSINDSTREELTFSTYNANFKYSIKGSDRTIWNLAEQVSKQVLSASIALHDSIETALLANLGTNKSQVVVNANPRSGTWDGTNYVFGIANTDYDLFIQRLKGFMREQYYKGVALEAIMDETLWQKAAYLANQGAGNNANTQFQFGGVDFGEDATQELALDTGYVGMGYVFQMGGIGIVPWIPKLNREGFGEAGMNGGFYGTIPDPLGTGLTFAIHEYYTGADNESAAGETQDVDVQVEVSVDLAPLVAPESTANSSNVFKFGVLQ